MGIIFGITNVKEPSYEILKRSFGGHETVRKYQKYFIAEIAMGSGSNENDAFQTLAQYIGVFGRPANQTGTAMAMTAPVITERVQIPEKEATTTYQTPIYRDRIGEKLAFVIPFEYKKLEEIPRPSNCRIEIREIKERVIAAIEFKGWYSNSKGDKKCEELIDYLNSEDIHPSQHSIQYYTVAQYHPPFTLPWFRRNEVWIELDINK